MSYEYPEVDEWTEENLGIGTKPDGVYPLRCESAKMTRGKKNPDSEHAEVELSFTDDPAAGTITHLVLFPSMAKNSTFDPKGLKGNNFRKAMYAAWFRATGLKDGKKPDVNSWIGKEFSLNVKTEASEWPVGSGKVFRKNVLSLGSF